MSFPLSLSSHNYLSQEEKDHFYRLIDSLSDCFKRIPSDRSQWINHTIDMALEWHLPYSSLRELLFYLMKPYFPQAGSIEPFEEETLEKTDRLAVLDNYSALGDPEPVKKSERANKLRLLFYTGYVNTELALLALALHAARMELIDGLDLSSAIQLCEENDAVYMPFIEMLGYWDLRSRIGDLSLSVHKRRNLVRIKQTKDAILAASNTYHGEILKQLESILKPEGISAEIKPHITANFGLYQKMRQGLSLDELTQIRIDVVVASEEDCYQTLRWVHKKWGVVPGRTQTGGNFRDLIATPKFTAYSSLITKVMVSSAILPPRLVEFRIMTDKIEKINTYGALYQYLFDPNLKIKNAWWQDSKLLDFIANNAMGSSGRELYVFSPAGKVYRNLPNESTPIDYAYKIHSEIGNHSKRIWINGQPAQYSQKLRNGDLVEIELDPEYSGPDPRWQEVVKSSTALNQIKKELKKQGQPKGRQIINKILSNEIVNYKLEDSSSDVDFEAYLKDLAERLGYSGLNALYLDITDPSSSLENSRSISPNKIVNEYLSRKLIPYIIRRDGRPITNPDRIHLIQCNHKKEQKRVTPGTEIVGRIQFAGSSHEKLLVYRSDCPESPQHEEAIPLEWIENLRLGQPAKLEIKAVDRMRLLGDVLDAVYGESKSGIYLLSVGASVNREKEAQIKLTVQADTWSQIEALSDKFKLMKNAGIIHKLDINALSPLEKTLLREPDNLPNLYTLHAVSDPRLFKGRELEIQQILRTLKSSQNLLILYGINRMGKTSLLNYFCNSVAREYKILPAFVDMQKVTNESESGFWSELMKAVSLAISKDFPGRRFPRAAGTDELINYERFHSWLSEIYSVLHGWKIVISIDELNVIDEVWTPMEAKRVVSRLKSLIESENSIKFILCIQQTFYMQSLAKEDSPKPVSWPLLRTGTALHLQHLDRTSAEKLVREPMGEMLHFEDGAVERMLALTACHPYYLQIILRDIIDYLNIERRNFVTVKDVDIIVENVLRVDIYFHILHREYQGFNRFVLSALAALEGKDARSVPIEDIQGALERRGIDIVPRGLVAALEDLKDRAVIERDDDAKGYAFRVPLFGMWLLKNKPLELIQRRRARKSLYEKS